MAGFDQQGRLRLRKPVARMLLRQRPLRECLPQKLGLSTDGYAEAVSWLQAFAIAVPVLCGLYGLFLFLWT
jgi:hypothetical protein